MKIRMNCYGQNVDHLSVEERLLRVVPYQFKTINGVAYCRFDDKNKTAINRMEKTGSDNLVTQTWAYGEWDHCDSLTYYPINKILTLEV